MEEQVKSFLAKGKLSKVEFFCHGKGPGYEGDELTVPSNIRRERKELLSKDGVQVCIHP